MTTDTITPHERALLRFPGDLPGLLRRGSPVMFASGNRDVPRHLWGSSATVHRIAPSDLGIPLAALAVDGCEVVVISGLAVLSLDLTDATGRAHLAWWLLAQPAELLPEQIEVRDETWSVARTLRAVQAICDGGYSTDGAIALSLVARHVAGLEVKHG